MGLFERLLSLGVPKDKCRVRRVLPDDIIIDILSRLPAECVLKLRRVCKRWLALTSTPYFAQIHLKRSKPVLFLQLIHSSQEEGHESNRKFFIFFQLEDEYNSKKKKMTMMKKKMLHDFISPVEHKMLLKASCDGFLVFKAYSYPSTILVWNIVTRERLCIDDGPVNGYSSVHAMFLHPVSGEYTMLIQNESERTGHHYILYDFHLYSFTSKSWRQISSFHHTPEYDNAPVFHNNRLHWIARLTGAPEYDPRCDSKILTFDTITEEFRVMPHPGDTCSWSRHHSYMFFYEDAEGTLCLCWPKQATKPRGIEIWALEDYDKWVWKKRKYVAPTPEVLQQRGTTLNPSVMFEQELVYDTDDTEQLYRTHLHDEEKNQELAIIFDNPRRRRKENSIIPLPWTKSFVSLNAGIRRELA